MKCNETEKGTASGVLAPDLAPLVSRILQAVQPVFVSTNSGEPLSVSVISRVFETLQKAIPGLPIHLSPSWCREDWSQTLFQVIVGLNNDSPQNARSSEHAQLRSYLIVLWLVSVGLRRGELARLSISNFNIAMSQVTIVPNVNRPGRTLKVSDKLAQLTRHYVATERSNILGAREHAPPRSSMKRPGIRWFLADGASPVHFSRNPSNR